MVTRHTTPLVAICLLIALVGSLASGCVLVVDRGVDRETDYHYASTDVVRRFEVWGAGDVDFTADDRAVARIAPGGFLHIEERRSFRTRRVTVEPGAGGAVQITHTVNGRAQPDDAESREELARLFLRVIRRMGVGAEQRVGRILAQAGVEGVFDELDHLEGSRVNSRYLTQLLRSGDLDVAARARVADHARRQIASSGTRAGFLLAALPFYLTEDVAQDAYFNAVTSISSSGSRARVLVGALDHQPDRRMVASILQSTRSMSSSGTKARVLIAAADHFENDTDISEAFFVATDSISSSGDRARVLLRLIDAGDLDQASTLLLLRSAGRISSGGTRARVLMAATTTFTNEPARRDAYLTAASSISSSGDHARVLMHLLATASLDDASVSALLQSVRGISSSGSRARVLITAAERVRDSSELRAVYEDVARGFSSSGDRRRVLAAIGLNRSEA